MGFHSFRLREQLHETELPIELRVRLEHACNELETWEANLADQQRALADIEPLVEKMKRLGVMSYAGGGHSINLHPAMFEAQKWMAK